MASQFFLQVLVDRVRAGVISSWLPRRLGGGLGLGVFAEVTRSFPLSGGADASY